METHSRLLAAIIAASVLFGAASANDPDMLQDLCVADLNSNVLVNGFPCKTQFNANDFYTGILSKPGNTTVLGFAVTSANVVTVPGLNTLGVSLSRLDYAPGGLVPPHTHPRGTELIFVLYGELQAGFITSANVLVSKTIKTGEVFVFPRGLIHFSKNVGSGPAAVLAAFNSQLPGAQVVAPSLFGATPAVSDDVLSMAFQIDAKVVRKIKRKFAPK